MNKDRLAEILEIKGRGPQATNALRQEIEKLQRTWEALASSIPTGIDYFPIRTVTLMEVFSRAWIAQLVDHGSPYVERVPDLKVDPKFDLTLVQAIHGRKVTLGDVIAYGVPLNSFGQVMGCFKKLTGDEFEVKLGAATDSRQSLAGLMRQDDPPSGRPPIVADIKWIWKTLSRLYEVRHILCHECPEEKVYQLEEVAIFLEAARQFTGAADETLREIVYGGTSFDLFELYTRARKSLDEHEIELSGLVEAVRKKYDPHLLALFEKAEITWQNYRDAECELWSGSSDDGLLKKFLWWSQASELTLERIERLKGYIGEDN
jgi:uncharacterized protein YecT (DUF1311 family)